MDEDEKWTVLTKGNEEVWSKERVKNSKKSGKTLATVGFILGLILLLIGVWQIQPYVSLSSHFGKACTNIFFIIGIILIAVGIEGANIYGKALHAEEVHKVKKNKEN